jgi:hypothetical protein
MTPHQAYVALQWFGCNREPDDYFDKDDIETIHVLMAILKKGKKEYVKGFEYCKLTYQEEYEEWLSSYPLDCIAQGILRLSTKIP